MSVSFCSYQPSVSGAHNVRTEERYDPSDNQSMYSRCIVRPQVEAQWEERSTLHQLDHHNDPMIPKRVIGNQHRLPCLEEIPCGGRKWLPFGWPGNLVQRWGRFVCMAVHELVCDYILRCATSLPIVGSASLLYKKLLTAMMVL